MRALRTASLLVAVLSSLMVGCGGGGGGSGGTAESGSSNTASLAAVSGTNTTDSSVSQSSTQSTSTTTQSTTSTKPPSPPTNVDVTPDSSSSSQISARGVFASSGSLNSSVRGHAQAKGVLIRVNWADIEPSPGSYDFSQLDNQVNQVKAAGKGWSLGVLGGPAAPSWLYSGPYNVLPLNISFRTSSAQVPQFWDTVLQQRLSSLAQALGQKYGSDADLKLVYVPQMTANGIEGHFNGTSDSMLKSQGLTEDLWVNAVVQAGQSFAAAFPDKPIAIELHYILGSANAGKRIMQAIEADSALLKHVGVALWWLSGKTDYQADLLTAFGTFKGPVYAQLIDSADNTSAFLNGDYSTAFTQAKSLNIKYIEPWDVDFTSHKWDTLFQDFNTYSQQ